MSDLYDTFLGPLGKEYCVLFFVMVVISLINVFLIGFVELGKELEPLAVDAIETDSSFADDASSGSAGDFKYSDVNGDHLYIHDGTEWHNINGA